MGQSRWIDDDQTRRNRTPSFPSHESIVPRNAQKQRRWTIIDTILCRWNTIESVVRTIISVNQLSIYGAVSDLCEEYSARQTRTGETRVGRTIWPIVRASKIIDNDTYIFDWNSCTRNFIAKVQGTSGKAFTRRSSDKELYWCRIPGKKQLKSDSASGQSTLTSSHNLQNRWHVVRTLCQEMQNQLT